jgi:hypothetical protein
MWLGTHADVASSYIPWLRVWKVLVEVRVPSIMSRTRGSIIPLLVGGPDGTRGGSGPSHGGPVQGYNYHANPPMGPVVISAQTPVALQDGPRLYVVVDTRQPMAISSHKGPALTQQEWVPHIWDADKHIAAASNSKVTRLYSTI